MVVVRGRWGQGHGQPSSPTGVCGSKLDEEGRMKEAAKIASENGLESLIGQCQLKQ